MQLSNEAHTALNKMQVQIGIYQSSLINRFGTSYVGLFSAIIKELDTEIPFETWDLHVSIDLYSIFTKICESVNYLPPKRDSFIFTEFNDLFHIFKIYKNDGIFMAYKFRQSAYLSNFRIVLKKENIIDFNIPPLKDHETIYRGISLAEHNNGLYGQSWTTNLDIARSFPKGNERNNSLVVQCNVRDVEVLYYELDDEFEVIVTEGCIDKSKVIINELYFKNS